MTTTQTPDTSDVGLHAWGQKSMTKSKRFTGRRWRSVPRLLIGVLLVVVCAAGGTFAGIALDERVSAVVLARSMVVGQVILSQDLRLVDFPPDSGVDVVVHSSAGTVVGQRVAYDLPAGTVLTRSALGSPQSPPRGKGVAAVGLKPGQFPPGLTRGATVSIIAAAPAERQSWTGVVVAVTEPLNDTTTVVSLQLSIADARHVASYPAGKLTVIEIEEGGR